MHTDDLRCLIFDIQGKVCKLNVSETYILRHMEFLNTFCGIEPIKWIGHSGHHKVFRLTEELKQKIFEITEKYDFPEVKEFFTSQPSDSLLLFIRIGALHAEIEKYISEGLLTIGTHNFVENYDFEVYGDTDEEVFMGPEEIRDCVCRFCGRRGKSNFKRRNAHAIPEALGNKLIFCNDECRICNSSLSPVDKELTEYLKFRRAANEIRGKKNKIIKVTGHNFYYDGRSKELRISKYAILDEKDDEIFLKLECAEPISHYGIYKSLTKIAIDLLPRELVDDYTATINWIKGEIVPPMLPNVYFVYHNSVITQPVAMIFARKSSLDMRTPECVLALRVMDLTFLFMLPLGSYDRGIGRNGIELLLPSLLEVIRVKCPSMRKEYCFPVNIGCINMAEREGKFSHVTQWWKKTNCIIVNQSEFNHVQEKDPNQIDFPAFESGKFSVVNIKTVIDDHFHREDGTELYLEQTYPICNRSISLKEKSNVVKYRFDVEIKSLDLSKIYLKAESMIVATYTPIEEVVSTEFGEVSPFLVQKMMQVAFEDLGHLLKQRFPKYEFSRLAQTIMEGEGNVLQLHDGVERTVIPHGR